MKIFIVTILTFFVSNSFAQDFLHFANGTKLEVKIFLVDKEKDILGYIVNNETKYRSISSLKSYQLNSALESSDSEVVNQGSELNGKLARSYDGNLCKYRYGKWSLSTDLWGVIPFNNHSFVTIEPEYEFSPYFSLKMPLRFLVSSRYGDDYNYPLQLASIYDYSYVENERPVSDYSYYGAYRSHDTRRFNFQLGVNPKLFPWGKSRSFFSPYLSPSFEFATFSKLSYENYYALDTVTNIDWGGQPVTNWVITDVYSKEIPQNYTMFSYEFLFGSEFALGKDLNATIELGINRVTSKLDFVPNEEFISYFNVQALKVSQQEVVHYDNTMFVFRLLLTYRFGGQSDID